MYAVIVTNGMYKTSVCKIMVEEKQANFISEVGGKKVYFCSEMCEIEFYSSPKVYGY